MFRQLEDVKKRKTKILPNTKMTELHREEDSLQGIVRQSSSFGNDIAMLKRTFGNTTALMQRLTNGEDTNQGQLPIQRVIQRMPTRAQAIEEVGIPKKQKTKRGQLYLKVLVNLYEIESYIQQEQLGDDPVSIQAQFLHLKHLHDDLEGNLSGYQKKGGGDKNRGIFIDSLRYRSEMEKEQYIPIMLNAIDNAGSVEESPTLQEAIAQGGNNQTITLNTTDKEGTDQGGMNEVGFYKEGVFKAPKLHLTNEMFDLSVNGFDLNSKQLADEVGISSKIAYNEYHIGGTDLKLREDDSLINREIASSYLDRLLGTGVIIRTERALQQDGIKSQEGIIMDYAKGEKMVKFAKSKGYEGVMNETNIIRDLSKLQLLDNLALQVDRHMENYVVQTDESGNVTGIMGFDNDMSFGRRDDIEHDDKTRINELPGMVKYVDKELAERIMQLKPEMLRWVMEGLLEPDVIEYLLARLEIVQIHLREHEDKWLKPGEWEAVIQSGDLKKNDKQAYSNSRKHWYKSYVDIPE